jgi:hypothetical protein
MKTNATTFLGWEYENEERAKGTGMSSERNIFVCGHIASEKFSLNFLHTYVQQRRQQHPK